MMLPPAALAITAASSLRTEQDQKEECMAKEDTRQGPAAATSPTATTTKGTSEPATRTEPQVARSAGASPPAADPMVAWFEERIALEQYSSPAWQVLTSALEFYRGLKS